MPRCPLAPLVALAAASAAGAAASDAPALLRGAASSAAAGHSSAGNASAATDAAVYKWGNATVLSQASEGAGCLEEGSDCNPGDECCGPQSCEGWYPFGTVVSPDTKAAGYKCWAPVVDSCLPTGAECGEGLGDNCCGSNECVPWYHPGTEVNPDTHQAGYACAPPVVNECLPPGADCDAPGAGDACCGAMSCEPWYFPGTKVTPDTHQAGDACAFSIPM